MKKKQNKSDIYLHNWCVFCSIMVFVYPIIRETDTRILAHIVVFFKNNNYSEADLKKSAYCKNGVHNIWNGIHKCKFFAWFAWWRE
jgi:hypothetical protein